MKNLYNNITNKCIFNKKKLGFSIITLFVMSFLSQVNGQICPATPGSNLVTNGNFQSGCTSFATEYTFNGSCNGGSITPGQWTVTNNANARNSFFQNPTGPNPPGEPTSPTNQYLVIDADGVANKDAWSSNVTVLAGTTYFFSAWISNINGTFENPPVLRFSIDGTQLGTNLTASSSSHAWQQFYVVWVAPANATITIRIENLITSSLGNDLALDAVNFSTSCSNIPNLNALGVSSVLPDTVFNCNVDFPFTLNPGLPGSYDFKWKQVPAVILSTATTFNVPPTPANGSKYYLCYEFIPGCPRADSVIFRVTPIAVNLGSDKVQCPPVNIVLSSGVSSSSATISWFRNNILIPSANAPNYTATQIGTYRVDITRPGCTAGSDELIIASPTSSIGGSGTYCAAGNTAEFTATGSTQIKWYTVPTGGAALNPSNSNPTITLAHTATNTAVPGCASGLYAEDISSYPGLVIPASSVATAPCAATNNYNGNSELLVEVNQTLALTSVDYFQNAGWGNGTFTFSIFNNGPTSGPHCGSCSPAGPKDGSTGGAIYSVTTATLTQPGSGSLQRTLPVSYTLTPGKYWFRMRATGTAVGIFDCTPSFATGQAAWQSPYIDNTGNNVLRAILANKDGNYQSSGALFNMRFQVGAANTCPRLFICGVENCTAPVTWISFDANKSDSGNLLSWVTGSEQNSSFYQIQRSLDGLTFDPIGQLPAAGNSDQQVAYTFLDATGSGSSSVIYYRIYQVDLDGKGSYSEMKAVYQDATFELMTLYPVPVKRGTNAFLELHVGADEVLRLTILNSIGQTLTTNEQIISKGTTTLELQTSQLSSGVYYINVIGSVAKTLKFLID